MNRMERLVAAAVLANEAGKPGGSADEAIARAATAILWLRRERSNPSTHDAIFSEVWAELDDPRGVIEGHGEAP